MAESADRTQKERFRAALERLKLLPQLNTQEKMMVYFGVSQSTMSNWLTGKSEGPLEARQKIVAMLPDEAVNMGLTVVIRADVDDDERYPNRAAAVRLFSKAARCSEEEVRRYAKAAAVALDSDTDPSVETWMEELDRARSYVRREERGHRHLGERKIDPDEA